MWGRAVDTNVSITAHEADNAFTLEATPRGFRKIDPFVIRWEYPLMVRDDGLNPEKLRTAICKKPVYTVQDVIGVLAAENLATVRLRELVMESTGMSQSKFYELIPELKKTPGVAYDEAKRLWMYQNPNPTKLQ